MASERYLLGRLFDLYCAYDERFDVPSDHPDYNDDFHLVLYTDGSGGIWTHRKTVRGDKITNEHIEVVPWESLDVGIATLEFLLDIKQH